MSASADEHLRTMAFADIALGQLKALHQLARPAIMKSGTPTRPPIGPRSTRASTRSSSARAACPGADLEGIYETYLSPARLTDKSTISAAR
jgi:diguanylate cyclase